MTSVDSVDDDAVESPRWLILVLGGIAAIVVGALLVLQPAATATLLLLALGIYWLVTGAVGVLGAVTERDSTWVWRLFGGLFGMLAGVVLVLAPQVAALVTVFTLYFGLAIAAIVIGLFEIGSGLFGRRRDWAEAALGVLQILIGIFLFATASGGALALFVPLLGLSAIASGVILLGSGIARRGAQQPAPA